MLIGYNVVFCALSQIYRTLYDKRAISIATEAKNIYSGIRLVSDWHEFVSFAWFYIIAVYICAIISY